jgi:hypothetical protein
MLAFRSEAHVDRWSKQTGLERGVTFPLQTAWRLADAWYGDRLEPDWRRRKPIEAQAVFESLGLTGDFWRLA